MTVQLTDDAIDKFVLELSDYLALNPLVVDPMYIDNEGFDHLSEFVHQRLERFSNGHRNYK